MSWNHENLTPAQIVGLDSRVKNRLCYHFLEENPGSSFKEIKAWGLAAALFRLETLGMVRHAPRDKGTCYFVCEKVQMPYSRVT